MIGAAARGRRCTAPAGDRRSAGLGTIALVHDWLTGMRGGEKALEVMCERFPGAELFTLVHIPGSVSPVIERPTDSHLVHPAPAGGDRHYRHYLPLFPTAVERFHFDRFDLVLSVSHCCGKSVITPPDGAATSATA